MALTSVQNMTTGKMDTPDDIICTKLAKTLTERDVLGKGLHASPGITGEKFELIAKIVKLALIVKYVQPIARFLAPYFLILLLFGFNIGLFEIWSSTASIYCFT